MKINYAILKNAFRAAIQEAVGPMEANQENPLDKKLIDCSPYRFSDALFVVKRFNREGETYKAHESAEEFNARWTVFFADFKNYPRRHAKVPRQQIKYANEIIVQSIFGAEVADGMQPEAFDPYMAICFMNCLADTRENISWTRQQLNGVMDRALKIYSDLEMKGRLEAELEVKASKQVVKI